MHILFGPFHIQPIQLLTSRQLKTQLNMVESESYSLLALGQQVEGRQIARLVLLYGAIGTPLSN